MKLIKFLVFLFPILFALPDLAIDLEVINLRFDDITIYLLFVLNVFVFYQLRQDLFIKTQFYLLLYALVSLALAFTLYPDLISTYEVTRTVGSIPYLLVLPYIFHKPEYRKYMYYGVLLGGLIYLGSIYANYSRIVLAGEIMKTHSSFKKSMSFSTLNPNSVATIALIFSWLNLLAYSERKYLLNLILGLVMLLVPFFIFARGSSIGVIFGVAILILYHKKDVKKYLFYFVVFISIWFLVLKYINRDLLESATKIDVTTGEGTSGRFVLWKQAFAIIKQSPIVGNGFATENGFFSKVFDGHMAHQLLLHYTLELGVIVLLLFLFSIIKLVRRRIKYYKKTNNLVFLIQLALITAFFVADMTGQLLYFNKYAYIIFVMATFNPLNPVAEDV